MKKRYDELDSLRGLAALSVVFFHYLSSLPIFTTPTSWAQSPYIASLTNTPLHLFWAGSEAVIFFFILSGFVLSLHLSKKGVGIKAFLVKRFFRIYPAYYVAIAIAIGLCLLLRQVGHIQGLSDFFNNIWKGPLTFSTILNHITLVRYFGYGQFNPVLWTLVMEVRISLIFPIIMVFINRYSWKLNLIGGLCLSLFYYTLSNNGTREEIFSIPLDYVSTLSFIMMFVIGAVLAKHHSQLITIFKKFSSNTRYVLLLIAILLYTVRFWLLSHFEMYASTFLSDISIAAGVSLFILLAMSMRSEILKKNPLVFLGKISYSLYLYHAIALLAFVHLLYPSINIVTIWVLSFITTLIVSIGSYTVIEKPAIRLGHHLAKKL